MTGFGDGRECPSVVIPVKIKTGISFDLDPRVEPEDGAIWWIEGQALDVFGVWGQARDDVIWQVGDDGLGLEVRDDGFW